MLNGGELEALLGFITVSGSMFLRKETAVDVLRTENEL